MVFTKKCNICNKSFTKYHREKLCPKCWEKQRSWTGERRSALSSSVSTARGLSNIAKLIDYGKNNRKEINKLWRTK